MIIEERKKKKTNFTKKGKKLTIVMIVIFGFFVPYVGFFLYAMEDYNSCAYNLAPPDPDNFKDIHASRLNAMAMWYEKNIRRYHMPHNMIVNTHFDTAKSPYDDEAKVISHSVTYDSAEWTGHYLMAEAFRYAVHKRERKYDLAIDAKFNIRNALIGIDKILHVSGNGGMARYAWPVSVYPHDDPADFENHYEGKWNGAKYIYEDDTSRDMHNGVIMGLGFVYLLVDDDNIREKVQYLVEDMLDYFLDTGWLYMKPGDDPNGTDLDSGFWIFGTAGIWTLSYLKVGCLVNPDKYEKLYHEYAHERDYAHRSALPFISRTNVIQSYYGLLLDWEVLFILLMLEEDQGLREIYYNYIAEVYDYTKHDRNAQFNTMWLAINNINEDNANEEEKIIIGDIGDCLMRYYGTIQRFPGRAISLKNENIDRSKSENWVNFFKSGIGSYFYPFYREIYQFEVVADTALTPDLRPQTDYLWSRPPYWFEQVGDGTMEGPGVDFTAVYWACRYYNIIKASSDYNAVLEVEYAS